MILPHAIFDKKYNSYLVQNILFRIVEYSNYRIIAGDITQTVEVQTGSICSLSETLS